MLHEPALIGAFLTSSLGSIAMGHILSQVPGASRAERIESGWSCVAAPAKELIEPDLVLSTRHLASRTSRRPSEGTKAWHLAMNRLARPAKVAELQGHRIRHTSRDARHYWSSVYHEARPTAPRSRFAAGEPRPCYTASTFE